MKSLEAEQLAASVADLQRQLEEVRVERRQADVAAEQLQRRIEQETSEQEALRRRLQAREQELEEVVSTRGDQRGGAVSAQARAGDGGPGQRRARRRATPAARR